MTLVIVEYPNKDKRFDLQYSFVDATAITLRTNDTNIVAHITFTKDDLKNMLSVIELADNEID